MRRAILLIILVLGAFQLLMAQVPSGWFVAGNDPKEFTVSTDSATYAGKPSIVLRSAAANPTGFVTLMQTFLPDGYTGKRVRFSGAVKSDRVTRWAGLWMRIDAGNLTAGFDNMQERPIKATTDWTRYNVVLDVPVGTTSINFGILLDGPGAAWLSGVTFEVVDNDVPVTAMYSYPSAPQNLDLKP